MPDTDTDLQNSCSPEALPVFPEWVEQAWRMYCRGQRNWTALARALGVKDYRTVQSAVRKFGDAVRAAGSGSGVDAWQEAVTAQEEILAEAWRIHVDPDAKPNDKVAALKVAATAVEQIAGLNGVVTKRVAVTGPNGGPVQHEHSSTLTLLADPEACSLATQLVARLSGGAEPIADEANKIDAEPEG